MSVKIKIIFHYNGEEKTVKYKESELRNYKQFCDIKDFKIEDLAHKKLLLDFDIKHNHIKETVIITKQKIINNENNVIKNKKQIEIFEYLQNIKDNINDGWNIASNKGVDYILNDEVILGNVMDFYSIFYRIHDDSFIVIKTTLGNSFSFKKEEEANKFLRDYKSKLEQIKTFV